MEPQEPPELLKEQNPKQTFLDTPEGTRTIRMAAGVCFFLAVLMVSLYFVLLKKDWNIGEALIIMRQFSIEFDSRYETRDDFEVIALAQNLSNELIKSVNRNEELQEEIDTLVETLDQWVAYKMYLYLFSKDVLSFSEAIEECKLRDAELISVFFGDEQAYIDKQAHVKKKEYWIGLTKNDSVRNGVLWLNGRTAEKVYWDYAAKQPNIDGGDCVFVSHKCAKIKRCWHYDNCANKRLFLCKKIPKAKWFYPEP